MVHCASWARIAQLKVIAERGPRVARQALSGDLEGSRTLTADSTRELLARLEAEGLIHGDAELDLTPEGKRVYISLREFVAAPTAELLGQFAAEVIATTVRTLQTITEQAAKGLAAAGGAEHADLTARRPGAGR